MILSYYHILFTLNEKNYHQLSVISNSLQMAYVGMYKNLLEAGYDWWFIKNKVWVSEVKTIANYRNN